MTTATRKQRQAPEVAHGTCRWVGPSRLQINDTTYLVQAMPGVGYRLTKDDGTVYDVTIPLQGPWGGDCADAVYSRPRATTADARECKHARSLRAALAHKLQARPLASMLARLKGWHNDRCQQD